MDIPNIIFQISKVFAWVSIGLELLAVIVLAVAVFSGDYNSKTSAARDFFKSGARVRNTALCFLGFLFLIANKGLRIDGMSTLSAVSSACKTYAFLSVFVFASSILLSIISAIKKVSFSDTKDLIKHIGNSSIWSMILGFLLAYFLYIP